MKALTVKQPYASLIIRGYKRCETRSWHTNYRGPLAIHAALDPDPHIHDLLATYAAHLSRRGFASLEDFPNGLLLGTVALEACLVIAERRSPLTGVISQWEVSQCDRAFGDWRPGRYAWRLANPQPL